MDSQDLSDTNTVGAPSASLENEDRDDDYQFTDERLVDHLI